MRYYISLYLLFLTIGATAQSPRFDQLSVEDGLSQNTVNCILKDHRDYLWIGTNDGLNRYNGYEFEPFRFQKEDSTSISNNKIYTLLEDGERRLWMGTSRGLNVYDAGQKEFRRVADFERAFIRHLLELENGQLWVATRDGKLYRSNVEKTRFEEVAFPKEYAITEACHLLAVDDNNLLIATNLHGVFRLNIKDLNWQYQALPEERSNSTKVLFRDSNNRIWVGTQGFGAYILDENLQLQNHLSIQNGQLQNNIIKSIEEDENGQIWLATDGAGISIHSESGIQQITHDLNKKSALNSNAVYSIYNDDKGIIWIGTFDGGISILNPYKEKFNFISTNYQPNKGLSHRAVLSFLEGKDGTIWIGTDGGGLNEFDKKTLTFKYYNSESPESLRPASDVITALFQDELETIWIGTYLGGLQAWHPERGSIVVYQHDNNNARSIRNDNVWAIEATADGKLLIGTLEGLDLFDPKTEQFQHIQTSVQQDEIYKERVTELYKDRSGKVWVGGQGVRFYNEMTQQLERLPVDLEQEFQQLDTRAFYDDSRGNFWIGTEGGGLFLLDRTRMQLQNFNTTHGLPSNSIHTIQEDTNGQLWMSTNNGLVRFDPTQLLAQREVNAQQSLFKIYHRRDGLQSDQFSYNADLRASDGTLYFGGINGFNYFKADQIQDNPFVPNVEITGLKIFDQYVAVGEKQSPLQTSIENTQELELNHEQSQLFTLEFTALNFTSSSKNQYAYQLEGFLDDWNYIGTRRSATFTNLNPGTYTFRVKAANNDGVWNEAGRSLTLVIKPPFWKSTLAYFLYIATFVGLLIAFRATLLFRERLKNRIQIKELEKDKLEEINRMKLAFFTDISHEFRTPLTLIAAPVEHLLDKKEQFPKEVQQQLGLVQRNTNRLLRLVNQLLEFRKINDKKAQLKLSKIELVSYLRHLKEAFDDLAQRLDIRFEFQTELEDYQVEVDRDKLETIVYNLLSNAFKYAKSEVVLSLAVEEEGDYSIKIKDDGIGIPESEQAQVFDRFYQAKRGKGRSMAHAATPGTGIGLAFVKALVEMHQGDIQLESQPDEGCMFMVILPQRQNSELLKRIQSATPQEVVVADIAAPDIQENESQIAPVLSTRLPLMLVVEDNEEVRLFIKSSFQKEFQVIEAEDGVEGIEMALKYLPDFIISDVMMPNKDGMELCETLKQDDRTSHIPILLLTASTNEERWMQGLETGADDYITKPFKLRVLKARIQNILDSRQRLRRHFSRTILEPNNVAIESSDDNFLQRSIVIIEEQLGDSEFGVDQLARDLGMSRSVLYRKFSALVDQPVKEFINMIRMKRAAQLLLQDKNLSIAEIAYTVGFSDARYFSKKFKKFYHKTPTQYLEEMKTSSET